MKDKRAPDCASSARMDFRRADRARTSGLDLCGRSQGAAQQLPGQRAAVFIITQ